MYTKIIKYKDRGSALWGKKDQVIEVKAEVHIANYQDLQDAPTLTRYKLAGCGGTIGVEAEQGQSCFWKVSLSGSDFRD